MKLVHWPLMGWLLHLVHLFAVPNVTAHPSTASVPITVLLNNDPLLCGFNVPIIRVNTLGCNYRFLLSGQVVSCGHFLDSFRVLGARWLTADMLERVCGLSLFN